MLTFNQLLHRGGLDPSNVRLVRHRDPKPEKHRLVYKAAMRGEPQFGEYQDIQATQSVIEAFRAAQHLAGFVVEPVTKQTVFVGLWDRLGERALPVEDPFNTIERAGAVAFETKRRDAFDVYRGRLVVEWGDGARAWVQRADNQDKPIIELRHHAMEPEFPGFAKFQRPLDDIEGLPVSWTEALRSVRGIYLLVHRESGQQYVGSAYGEDGFFGRWKSYSDGHGGNVAMKELGAPADSYDVAILDVVGSDVTDVEVFAREIRWKAKLGSRAKGLNRN